MTAKITARIDGIRELLRDLRDDPVHAAPLREAFQKGADLAAVALRQYRPGQGQALAKTAVDKREVPRWSRARMSMKAKRGFRYLGALHGSKRIQYHYRVGRFRGAQTYGWMDKARESVQGRIWPLIQAAEQEIQQRWGRR